ncbi:MAG: hypothetical protein KDA75_00935, partial [Planctomycetaceae bacterium]|nr:hypothetical protein [Planctomycetaceae bacterium]
MQAPNTNYQKYISSSDPFRPEIRKLLTVDFGALRGNRNPQARLQLNGILSDETLGTGKSTCFDAQGNPRFRPLVPHPTFQTGETVFVPSAMVHANGAALPYNFSAVGGNKQAQEWWARYDRQRLARDIYTVLWTVCVPPGLATPPDSPWATVNPYSTTNGFADNDADGVADIVQEMAQFAVNA